MSLVIPTVDQLSKQARAAVKGAIPGSDPLIWPNNLYFVLKTFAQMLGAVWIGLDYVRKQARVVTADGDALDDHGVDNGLVRNAATYAIGDAVASTAIGSVIPTQSLLVRSDGGEFLVVGDYTAVRATTRMRVRAREEGKAGNTEGGTSLELVTPIAGVGNLVVDDDGLRGGAETENDQSFRKRIIDKKQNPPHGGSPGEYKVWAKEVPGVTKVWVKRASPAPGSVLVVFTMDQIYANGIPREADEGAVLEHLEEVAPSNAKIYARGPVGKQVNVTIDSLVPDTQDVRDQIELELRAMFKRRAEPAPFGGTFTFSKSWISEAISTARDEKSHILTAPAADVVAEETTGGELEMPILGTIAYT